MRLLGLITAELEAIADLFLGAGLPVDGGEKWKKIKNKNTALKIYRQLPSTFIAHGG